MDLNDNGGDGEEGGGHVPVQQPQLAIESLDDYVQRFGLSHAVGKTLQEMYFVHVYYFS